MKQFLVWNYNLNKSLAKINLFHSTGPFLMFSRGIKRVMGYVIDFFQLTGALSEKQGFFEKI